jgi:hypothetical protein
MENTHQAKYCQTCSVLLPLVAANHRCAPLSRQTKAKAAQPVLSVPAWTEEYARAQLALAKQRIAEDEMPYGPISPVKLRGSRREAI